jgi:hypothetical protein
MKLNYDLPVDSLSFQQHFKEGSRVSNENDSHHNDQKSQKEMSKVGRKYRLNLRFTRFSSFCTAVPLSDVCYTLTTSTKLHFPVY